MTNIGHNCACQDQIQPHLSTSLIMEEGKFKGRYSTSVTVVEKANLHACVLKHFPMTRNLGFLFFLSSNLQKDEMDNSALVEYN